MPSIPASLVVTALLVCSLPVAAGQDQSDPLFYMVSPRGHTYQAPIVPQSTYGNVRYYGAYPQYYPAYPTYPGYPTYPAYPGYGYRYQTGQTYYYGQSISPPAINDHDRHGGGRKCAGSCSHGGHSGDGYRDGYHDGYRDGSRDRDRHDPGQDGDRHCNGDC